MYISVSGGGSRPPGHPPPPVNPPLSDVICGRSNGFRTSTISFFKEAYKTIRKRYFLINTSFLDRYALNKNLRPIAYRTRFCILKHYQFMVNINNNAGTPITTRLVVKFRKKKKFTCAHLQQNGSFRYKHKVFCSVKTCE